MNEWMDDFAAVETSPTFRNMRNFSFSFHISHSLRLTLDTTFTAFHSIVKWFGTDFSRAVSF